ncbi:MAG: tetratricopeptide repeat protein, partial [Planctomycetota bacterium]
NQFLVIHTLGLKQVIIVHPDNGTVTRQVGQLLLEAGQAEEGLKYLVKAAALLPQDVKLLTTVAWQLATHPDARVRDGKRAVALAEQAVEGTHRNRPEPLDALAAAYAEVGHFDDALRTVQEALTMAGRVSPKLAGDLRARATLYQRRKPYRQKPPR